MRKIRALSALLAFLVMMAVVAFPTLLYAQQALPYDAKAVFRTHVPHLNSRISTGGGGAATGAVQAAAAATFTGSPYTVAARVAATSTFPAAEEHIAADPSNSSGMVAAISDFSQRGGFNTTKYASSLDNGTTWTEAFLTFDANGVLHTGDGESWDANSDPVIAIDKMGNVYLADLYLDALAITNGFYVSVGSIAPASGPAFTVANTFAVATNPTLFPLPQSLEDKPWIAVDNSNNAGTTGTVYASWTRFVGNSLTGFTSDMIVLSRSVNHGITWSAPRQISLPAQNGAVQGSQVAVGPGGEVYVAYEVFFVGGKRQHFLAKSTDGGQTFSAPVAITPVFNDLRFNSTYRKNSFASLAVNPSSGFVYALYADQRGGGGAQVEFTRSTLAGATTFTAPVVINDNSAGQQFFPAIAADSSGRIHASWFDTRNSGSSSLYDIYAAFSLDNGATFSPNARVTAALVNAGTASFIGDYAGIAANAGFAHPVWTDGGFNNGRLQTALLKLP